MNEALVTIYGHQIDSSIEPLMTAFLQSFFQDDNIKAKVEFNTENPNQTGTFILLPEGYDPRGVADKLLKTVPTLKKVTVDVQSPE